MMLKCAHKQYIDVSQLTNGRECFDVSLVTLAHTHLPILYIYVLLYIYSYIYMYMYVCMYLCVSNLTYTNLLHTLQEIFFFNS